MYKHGLGASAGFRWNNIMRGALAGAVGVWVMDRVDWYAFRHEDPAARRQTVRVRPGGLDPAHKLANSVAEAAGMQLKPRQPHPAGMAVHYGMGVGPAAVYAAARHRLDWPGPVRGAAFGLSLFLLQDEGLNALTGLSAQPGEYPWQAHARGLIAHLVLGVTIDLALDAMERFADDRDWA